MCEIFKGPPHFVSMGKGKNIRLDDVVDLEAEGWWFVINTVTSPLGAPSSPVAKRHLEGNNDAFSIWILWLFGLPEGGE